MHILFIFPLAKLYFYFSVRVTGLFSAKWLSEFFLQLHIVKGNQALKGNVSILCDVAALTGQYEKAACFRDVSFGMDLDPLHCCWLWLGMGRRGKQQKFLFHLRKVILFLIPPFITVKQWKHSNCCCNWYLCHFDSLPYFSCSSNLKKELCSFYNVSVLQFFARYRKSCLMIILNGDTPLVYVLEVHGREEGVRTYQCQPWFCFQIQISRFWFGWNFCSLCWKVTWYKLVR